jgi:branched-chain amino acid transport system permease protein
MLSYLIHLLILISIYSILSLSLNLALGYTGLFNLAHIALYGIGAYTSALLTLRLALPFWFGLISAGAVSALFGYFLSFPTLKLKGDYLAIGTLGFAIIIESIERNWIGLTRGPLGLPGILKPAVFDTLPMYLLLTFIFAGLTYLIIKRLTIAPFGRVLKSIRDDEIAAESLGKNTYKFKTIVLTASAFFSGIAGSLYAHYITYIDPSSFSLLEVILVISMVMIGGAASNKGAILGSAVLILLPEPLRFIGFPSAMLGPLRQMIYSAILVLLILKRPRGLIGKYKFK